MDTFYIVQLTYWAGGIKPIAGPMSKEKAEVQRTNYPYIPDGGDISIMRYGHAKAVSRDWLTEHGFPYSPYGKTILTQYLGMAR